MPTEWAAALPKDSPARNRDRVMASRHARRGTATTLVGPRRAGTAVMRSPVGPLRKEIGTFSSIWNRWALPRGIVQAPAPTKGLIYKKSKARPPFQTWQQIERQVERGGLTEEQKETLWECMFLTLGEIDELLAFVRKEATRPLVHAMFVFAAHTGARRSEMLRSQIEDFDFVSGMVTIREKKRDRGKECTFRHVPMTPMLRQTMTEWFAIHPGGQLTVCEEPNVPMEPGSAHHHFRWTLDGSKWEPVHGWHTLRHSFCSNCAMKGLDQRIIDSWMGHQTEDMRRRYRHLFPDHQQHAMNQVFGKTAQSWRGEIRPRCHDAVRFVFNRSG
jgi:integrase